MKISLGKELIKIARKAIESALNNKDCTVKSRLKILNEKRGVFVTLHDYPSKGLRGCIGFPEPTFPLKEGVVKAAKASALEDPRFKPLSKEELNKVIIEVSVLTKPEEISAKEPKEIKVGEDGLIVRYGFFSGLLLPQVATEYNWTAEEFLSQTCIKAGLPPSSWLDSRVRIYKFQSEIFTEVKPNGEVKEVS